jgi:hypothetical protein
MKALRKKTWNVIIDTLAYIAFVVLSMTGVIMYFILPPGSGHSRSIWGLGRHDWGDIHFWAAVSFFSILVLHLILHWKWIVSVLKGTPRTDSRWRFLIGSVGLIAIVLVSLAPLLSPVENNGSKEHDGEKLSIEEGIYSVEDIKGSMTLSEVSEFYSVPINKIITFLELPGNVDTSMRLGQLKSEYGFDMHALRDFVTENRP